MATVRFYLDEHVPKAVAMGLRSRGTDVITVADAGMLGASDEDHLSLALRERRVIFTQDADFLRLHAAGADHAGIAFATQGIRVGSILQGLLLIHQLLDADEMRGHVEFL